MTPFDDRIRDKDPFGGLAVAIEDYPVLNPVVIADDQLARIQSPAEALKVEIVAWIGGHTGPVELANDRSLPSAFAIRAQALIDLTRPSVALKSVEDS